MQSTFDFILWVLTSMKIIYVNKLQKTFETTVQTDSVGLT